MRLVSRALGCTILCGFAFAQSAQEPDLKLRGGRFRPLRYAELTPAQKTMANHLLAGERHGLNGPFNALLRSPEMGDAAQQLGSQLRFHSSLPGRLNEMGILITARYWNAQYEWSAHKSLALSAGLSAPIVNAIQAGQRPSGMQPDEESVYNFASELLETKQVSDSAFRSLVDKFGERGAVDLTSLVGYYCFVSAILNVDRYPLPDGETPPLKPVH